LLLGNKSSCSLMQTPVYPPGNWQSGHNAPLAPCRYTAMSTLSSIPKQARTTRSDSMKTTQSDIEQRNTDVLEVLNMATPMLKRLAFQFNMEYDELHQMAAEAALLNYERAQEAEIPRAFLYGVVRNVLWYKPKEEPTL